MGTEEAMSEREADDGPVPTEGPWFFVRLNGGTVRMSFAKLFAAGHHVWLNSEFRTARKIFELLSTVAGRGPRAQIFLAHCLAMEGDYGGCSTVLHRALPREEFGDAASQLHDTFVLWKAGLFVDVKDGLKTLAIEFPNIPTFSLMLGDLLRRNGCDSVARKYFLRAIRNDRPGGGVGLSARALLQSDRRSDHTADSREPE
jgi:hypothetical protein